MPIYTTRHFQVEAVYEGIVVLNVKFLITFQLQGWVVRMVKKKSKNLSYILLYELL